MEKFTEEQKFFIASKIDDWYLEWKNRLTDFTTRSHKLGYAKELLIDSMMDKFTQEQEFFIAFKIGQWYLEWKDCLFDFTNKTHELGQAKELLREILTEQIDEEELLRNANEETQAEWRRYSRGKT